jgi:Ca-activated chloride channel family protein
VATLVLGLALLASAAPAEASGFLVPTPSSAQSPTSARMPWSIESYRVDVVVRGPHARITVEQVFRNLSSSRLEADYVFPLVPEAMVSSITLFEGRKGLEGRLLRDGEARRAYEEIVRRRKDPALLQYLGQNLYRVRIFPIEPGATRKLVLKYDQTLTSDAGLTELAYPLGATRFSAKPIRSIALRVDLETKAPLGPIYSPTHDVAVVRSSPNHAEVSYEGSSRGDPGDLLLYWSTTSRRIGAQLLTYWPKDEAQGYFLFLATPRASATPAAARPKHITFVVDTSGSMAGEKLEQVRAALKQVIGGLGAEDRFNVIAYHSSVVPLWEHPRPADPASRTEALAFVDGLGAEGGTNIEGALRAAMSVPRPRGMPSVVVFLTDGRPTMGETDTDKILASVARANTGRETRLFVLGVGVDVNTVMLDRLALENKGAPAFVRPRENVEVKVSSLYGKIRYPVLTDVTFEARGMQALDLLPASLPDLFRGSELVLAGRYRKGGPVEFVLSGRDAKVEREFHYTLHAARQGAGLRSDFPARVWATRRIAELLDAIRLHKQRDPELVNEIVRLSTKFGILTEYTSFLADETGVSHSALVVNAGRTLKNLDGLTVREVGGSGWAQSANQVARRGAARAPLPTRGYFLATEGDRDVRRVELGGVRLVANRTFYYRGTKIGWVDVDVPDAAKPAEVVTRWSPRFFELLRATTRAENTRLAQAGPLLLRVQGRVIRVVDGS